MDNILWIIGFITIVIGGMITLLKGYNKLQDRILAETTVKARESNAGATALAELVKANIQIQDELDRFKKDVEEDQRDIEKRFDLLRSHCEDIMRKNLEFMVNHLRN